ncbi:hypothetical protein BGZ61DRAFT_539771 [Ilyonectria robusta]|uniref:uncharacterized protein n=1 Tax=Ilyonectria robusta TaxID=1079257 RepID=UPI001E8CDE56|nr:uncharacterized protein BGZ61DRAFT_539771 [Ilyonectria robusta]KAH8661115.1 hypothetical protein BGZ61DRAFT_539771 [Ilyonectria robusta]
MVTSTSRILYGFLQDFRPAPGLRNQVYRYNFTTSAVTVVADDFTLPNGVHTDSKGRVYAGCGDGVHVRNLTGKIYAGTTAANFQFAGRGRMIITGQTKFFYATLAALGTVLT